VRIRLDPKDAERLGCDEILPLELWDISIVDLDALADRFEFDPDDWPTPLIGEIAFADAGDPDAQPVVPRWQKQAAVWLAVRMSGVDITWEQAGSVAALKVRYLDDEPGKDEAPSESSDPSTTGPSETSST
jgi:hypothetical protein